MCDRMNEDCVRELTSLARGMEFLREGMTDMKRDLTDLKHEMAAVREQTTKTNGRVSTLEKQQEQHCETIKTLEFTRAQFLGASAVITIMSGAVSAGLIKLIGG